MAAAGAGDKPRNRNTGKACFRGRCCASESGVEASSGRSGGSFGVPETWGWGLVGCVKLGGGCSLHLAFWAWLQGLLGLWNLIRWLPGSGFTGYFVLPYFQ